jgi:hypothetical protein
VRGEGGARHTGAGEGRSAKNAPPPTPLPVRFAHGAREQTERVGGKCREGNRPPLLTPAERAQRAEAAARRAQWLGEPPTRRHLHLLELRQRALELGLQLALLLGEHVEHGSEFGAQAFAFRKLACMRRLQLRLQGVDVSMLQRSLVVLAAPSLDFPESLTPFFPLGAASSNSANSISRVDAAARSRLAAMTSGRLESSTRLRQSAFSASR